MFEYTIPSFCQNCGNAYPWTQSAIEAASMLIEEEEGIDTATKKDLVISLPDLVTETPKTPIALVRFKKALLAAGKFTADGLRQFAIDFGCELVKKQLDL